MQNKKIVFLASDCSSSRWVYNALKKDFDFSAVIIENPVSKKTLFRNRLKKVGFLKVTGQALFSLLVVPFIRSNSKPRAAAIHHQYNFSNDDFTKGYNSVPSVNDNFCKELLQSINPDIVVVNGTRIISKNILNCTNARFINMHVGITPWYRGSHGGYWAVHNNDIENFGTTIHLVDTGVDTGSVLKQVYTMPQKDDNFVTYPILQTAIGIGALKEVLQRYEKGDIDLKQNIEKGKMYYQPTIWEYFLNKAK